MKKSIGLSLLGLACLLYAFGIVALARELDFSFQALYYTISNWLLLSNFLVTALAVLTPAIASSYFGIKVLQASKVEKVSEHDSANQDKPTHFQFLNLKFSFIIAMAAIAVILVAIVFVPDKNTSSSESIFESSNSRDTEFENIDYDEAKSLAEQGDIKSQLILAEMYLDGAQVQRSTTEAMKWLRLAAEQENALAQFRIATLYATGNGVAENHEEALIWYQHSAGNGFAPAQYFLANMYIEGEYVNQDYSEALKWLQLSSDQNFALAHVQLGQLYLYGNSVPVDVVEAIRLFRLAAEQGEPRGQEMLALMYSTGDGVPRNDLEAFKLFQLAAKQGLASSQYLLATSFEEGVGVRSDLALSYVWYSIAAAQGFSIVDGNTALSASMKRDEIAERLSTSQLTRAQEIATKCFNTEYEDCE